MRAYEDREWTSAHESALQRARVASPMPREAAPARPPPTSRRAYDRKLASLPDVEARLQQLGALDWSRRFCEERGIDLGEVTARGRSRSVVRVRHALWSILRDTLDLSLPEVGRIFGVDHTTVLAAVRKYHDSLAEEAA